MIQKISSLFLVFSLGFVSFICGQDEFSIIHGPYLQNLDQDEVTIVWLTNKNAIAWVEIAPDDNTNFYLKERPRYFASRNGIKLEGKVHAVKLTNLLPGTTYRYRIYSQEILSHEYSRVIYGETIASQVYQTEPLRFTTNDVSKETVNFSVINDIHQNNDKMDTLLRLANPMQNDMVFFNGDMVSMLDSEADLFNGFMDLAVNSFAKEIPMYFCRGNHETRGSFASQLQNYLSPLKSELYYIVRHGPVCFVVLDSGEDKPDSDIEYYGITDYDNYRTQQMEWLKSALRQKEFVEAPFKVAICHIPPRNAWHGDKEVLEKFVPLLNDAKIDLMLSGHLHRYINMPADKQVYFPVIINSDKAVVKGMVDKNILKIEVVDVDGKRIDSINIMR